MNEELKLCPFCGSKSASVKEERERYGVRTFVACSCGVSLTAYAADVAVSRWNQRPVEDALRARIAELEAQLTAEPKKSVILSA